MLNEDIWKNEDRREKCDIKIDFYEIGNLIFVVCWIATTCSPVGLQV
jgi:hypothetical protein